VSKIFLLKTFPFLIIHDFLLSVIKKQVNITKTIESRSM
jgi:hypothetical protein